MIKKLVGEYDRNGVIVVKRLFSLNEVNRLKNKINSYIKKKQPKAQRQRNKFY